VTRRVAATTVAVCIALAAAACTARPHPVPLDPSDDSAAAQSAAPPAVVEEESVTTIEEESLPDDSATTPPSGEPDQGLSVQPPSLAPTIDAGTAPNVAAATRLVDAGRARMAAGDSGAALEQLERAIAIDPENLYAYYYLAELHFMHRTYDQAIAFADRAATLSDARAPEWASRAYTLQGNAFEAAGRFADARGAYARAIQAAPGNLAAQVGLGRVSAPAEPQP
jgi:Flp pilus assembly protein TadD